MGVERVWILDPATRRAHIYRPDREPLILSGRQKLTDPQVLPGFTCVVGEFFED